MVFSADYKVSKTPEFWIEKLLLSDCFIVNNLE